MVEKPSVVFSCLVQLFCVVAIICRLIDDKSVKQFAILEWVRIQFLCFISWGLTTIQRRKEQEKLRVYFCATMLIAVTMLTSHWASDCLTLRVFSSISVTGALEAQWLKSSLVTLHNDSATQKHPLSSLVSHKNI